MLAIKYVKTHVISYKIACRLYKSIINNTTVQLVYSVLQK